MTHCCIRGCRKAAPKLLPCLPFLLSVIKSLKKSTCFFWFNRAIVQSPGGTEALTGAEPGGSAVLKLDSVKG